MKILSSLALLIIGLAVYGGAASALAQTNTQTPSTIGVNTPIPHSLQSVDQHNKPQDFDSIKSDKGAILVFVRSVDWCPFCQKQLIDLKNNYETIKQTGYSLVSISYDDVDALQKFNNRHNVPFLMLSDNGSEIIQAFGILNTDIKEGTNAYGIPHPAIYIVSNGGVIQSIIAEEGYKNRPSVEKIIETINQLSPNQGK